MVVLGRHGLHAGLHPVRDRADHPAGGTRSFDSYRMVIYSLVLILMMIFRPGGLLGSYDFSLSRVVEKIMNGELFKKNKEKEGADHE